MQAVLIGLLALLPAAGAHAGDDVKTWFQRAAQAVETLNYEVVMVFDRDDRLQTLRLLHSNDSGQVRERIESLDGAEREVVRQGRRVACNVGGIHILTGRGHDGQGLPVPLPGDPDALSAWYAFSLGEVERVAGRRCRGLRIDARDAYRYGYRLCLDEDSGLPLRSEILDRDGGVLERLVVTQLALYPKPLPAERFHVDWREEGAAPGDQGGAVAGGPQWRVGRLPPGYAVIEHDRYPAGDGRVWIEHIVASDGLAAVSVFVRPESEGLFEGLRRSGALHVFGQLRSPYHVTVMGEVPAVVVRMIGDSVRPGPERGDD